MKLQIILAAGALSLAGFSAQAGEFADSCKATLEAEGRDSSGCECLEGELIANPDLQEEFASLGEIADPEERYNSASDAAKAAMDKCTR